MAAKLKYLIPALAISFCSVNFLAQDTKSHLLQLLKSDKDTSKVNHLDALARELMNSNPDTAIILGEQEIEIISDLYNVPGPELEEEIKTNKSIQAQSLKRLLTNAYNTIGTCYRMKADYTHALLYFRKGLSFAEEMNDKSSMSKFFGNIGVCYRLKGNYPSALDYLLKALQIDETAGNKNGIASRLGGIGSVYWNHGDYDKALTNYLKALKINEELGDKKGIATNLGNIGSVFYQQSENIKGNPSQKNILFEKALQHYLQALKIAEEIDFKQVQSNTLGNIGSVYKDKGDYKGSLNYHLKGLKLAQELGDKNSIAYQLGNIGELYSESPSLPSPSGEVKTGYALAAKYLQRALWISDSIGAMDNVKNWYRHLSTLYEKTKVPLPDTIPDKLLNIEQTHLRALYYMKCYVAVRDSLFSEENKKQIKNREADFASEKKATLEKAEQEKKLALAETDKRHQRIIIFIMSCCLVIILMYAIFIFRSRKGKKEK